MRHLLIQIVDLHVTFYLFLHDLKKKKVHFTPFILVDIFLIRVFNKGANKQHIKQNNSARDTKHAKQDEK